MGIARRAGRMLAGLWVGLVLVEGALQVVGAGVRGVDTRAQHHSRSEAGGDLRVLCLGACYTVGVGAPAEQSYPSQLERALAADGVDAVVVNRGVRGKTVDFFAARIEPLIDAHQPDVVVVGVNRKMGLEVAPPPEHRSAPSALWDRLVLPKLVALALHGPSTPAAPTREEVTDGHHNARTADTQMLQQQGCADYLAAQIVALQSRVDADTASDDERKLLTNLYAARGDYDAAITTFRQSQPEGPPTPKARLVLFRYEVARGNYAIAQEHLARLQATPGLVARFEQQVASRKRQYAERGRDVELLHTIDRGRLAILQGDLDTARQLLEAALAMDPDSTDAHQALLFVAHQRGEALPEPAAATLARPESIAVPRGFEQALAAHLDRIAAAAEASGARVLVHNFAALPDQAPIIRRVAEARGLAFIDVMGALARDPDPDRYFHPTNHLRMSPAGNAWLAEQVRGALTSTDDHFGGAAD